MNEQQVKGSMRIQSPEMCPVFERADTQKSQIKLSLCSWQNIRAAVFTFEALHKTDVTGDITPMLLCVVFWRSQRRGRRQDWLFGSLELISLSGENIYKTDSAAVCLFGFPLCQLETAFLSLKLQLQH